MALGALGSLAFKLQATGFSQFAGKMGDASKAFTGMKSKMKQGLEGLKQSWVAMGAISLGLMSKMISASPRLRGQMKLISFQANRIFRIFGDELAPIFSLVADALKGVIEWFQGLPEPLQKAIAVGGAVIVMLGLLTLSWGLLSVAMSPITLVILAIAAAAALLYLIFAENLFGIRDIIDGVLGFIFPLLDLLVGIFQNIIDNILPLLGLAFDLGFAIIGSILESFFGLFSGIFEGIIAIFDGIITFIQAVFSGNLEGALDAIIGIFQSAFDLIVGIITWPITAIQNLIRDLMSGKIIGDLIKAGQALFDAVIEGIQKAFDAAIGIVHDLIDWFAGFFGGSLPERGPLKDINIMGQDLGTAYISGVSSGLQSASTTTRLEKHLHIGSISINAKTRDFTSTARFGRKLEHTAVRRASSW